MSVRNIQYDLLTNFESDRQEEIPEISRRLLPGELLPVFQISILRLFRAVPVAPFFQQESGRAGRDGKDSDCILYFRPQDASRLSALVCGELEGQGKR